jgi:oligosaccharide repeat unit polymerase
MLSGIMIFPMIVLLGRNLDAKPVKFFCLVLIGMMVFSIIAKPSTRTDTVTILVAVGIYALSTGKLKVSFLSVGILAVCAIVLLVFLDYLRQGNLAAGASLNSVYAILLGAYQNVGPADNGMILIDYLKHHSWLYFRYLLPSLSPTSMVPSAILPFKPRTDIEAILTYQLFGFDLDPASYHEGSTLTYTVPVAGYADFGFVGVAVAALLYGFMFSVFLRGWKSRLLMARFVTLYYLILLIAGFRLSVEALTSTVYWVIFVTWGMHFVSHFAFLRPNRVLGRGAISIPGAAQSGAET